MLVKKTAAITRHEEILKHLYMNGARNIVAAIPITGLFPHYPTMQLLEDNFIGRNVDRNIDGKTRPPFVYWITETGIEYYRAIESGALLNSTMWDIPFLFRLYTKYGNEQDYLEMVFHFLANTGELGEIARSVLKRVNHPAALGVMAGIASGGTVRKIPRRVRLGTNGYKYVGGPLSRFAQESIDRLMFLHEKREMKKHEQARPATVSSILELCILFTLCHYDEIEKAIKNDS